MEDKECCKWCDHCINTDIGHGYCYLDIGEYIKDTISECCSDYRYDGNLDRS